MSKAVRPAGWLASDLSKPREPFFWFIDTIAQEESKVRPALL